MKLETKSERCHSKETHHDCHNCSRPFSMFVRPITCRSCTKHFCTHCCVEMMESVPSMADQSSVRLQSMGPVCERCLSKQNASKKSPSKHSTKAAPKSKTKKSSKTRRWVPKLKRKESNDTLADDYEREQLTVVQTDTTAETRATETQTTGTGDEDHTTESGDHSSHLQKHRGQTRHWSLAALCPASFHKLSLKSMFTSLPFCRYTCVTKQSPDGSPTPNTLPKRMEMNEVGNWTVPAMPGEVTSSGTIQPTLIQRETVETNSMVAQSLAELKTRVAADTVLHPLSGSALTQPHSVMAIACNQLACNISIVQRSFSEFHCAELRPSFDLCNCAHYAHSADFPQTAERKLAVGCVKFELSHHQFCRIRLDAPWFVDGDKVYLSVTLYSKSQTAWPSTKKRDECNRTGVSVDKEEIDSFVDAESDRVVAEETVGLMYWVGGALLSVNSVVKDGCVMKLAPTFTMECASLSSAETVSVSGSLSWKLPQSELRCESEALPLAPQFNAALLQSALTATRGSFADDHFDTRRFSTESKTEEDTSVGGSKESFTEKKKVIGSELLSVLKDRATVNRMDATKAGAQLLAWHMGATSVSPLCGVVGNGAVVDSSGDSSKDKETDTISTGNSEQLSVCALQSAKEMVGERRRAEHTPEYGFGWAQAELSSTSAVSEWPLDSESRAAAVPRIAVLPCFMCDKCMLSTVSL